MIAILLAVLSFVLVFAIVVFVHELGHFWVARRVGVRVLRFSIGFGPVLWSKVDKHNTQFAVSAIPLGGYVKMLDGREQTLQEEEKPFAFDHKSVGRRMAVVVAGPLFNFLFAILAFAAVFMAGVPNVPAIIGEVMPDTPAAAAGLQKNDHIMALDGTDINNWPQLVRYVRDHAEQPIIFTIKRDNETLTQTIIPAEQEIDGAKIGTIGVTLADEAMSPDVVRLHKEDPLSALYKGVVKTWELSILTLDIIGKMLTGSASLENLAGPISIAQGAQQSVESGWISFVSFLILLSVNLGVINLLPIPMLDGGHLLYYVLEFMRGKPLSEKAQRMGFSMGVVLVLGLMLIGIYNDIARF